MTKQLINQLNRLSLPLILNSLLGMGIHFILTAIVGRISLEAMAVAGIIDGLVYAIIGIAGVGSLSFNIYASRVRVTHPSLFRDYFKSILELNLLIGCVGSIIIMALLPILLREFYGMSGDSLMLGTHYGQIVVMSLIPHLLIFAFSNQLKVQKKSHLIVVTGGISSVIHLLLAYGLTFHIFSTDNQLLGVGIASSVAVFFECGMYSVILRSNLKELSPIKSSQKRFLFIKSLPLLAQECLEGTLFNVILTAFLSRLGLVVFASYSLCRVLVDFAQIALFPYANGLLIAVGEAIGEKNTSLQSKLPAVAIGLNVLIYSSISLLMVVFSQEIVPRLSTQELVVAQAQKSLPVILSVFLSQLFFELTKYSLQAIGKEKLAVYTTALVNFFMVLFLVFLQTYQINSLETILVSVILNYGILGGLFIVFYRASIRSL